MKSAFLACGFTDVTSRVNLQTGNGMKRGDVIINTLHHTVMYIGNGRIVAARINENGKVSGGKTGDQTGMEIMIQDYYFYQYEWDCVLRYTKEDATTDISSPSAPAASSESENVCKGQTSANHFASAQIPVTGQRDTATVKAGIKVLQTALNKDYGAGLIVDGIFGSNTDKALGKHYVTSGECQYMVTAAEILLLLHGYNPNGVEIPGIFGSGLLAAVKAFQKAQGLTVSGTCDRNTFLKLIR